MGLIVPPLFTVLRSLIDLIEAVKLDQFLEREAPLRVEFDELEGSTLRSDGSANKKLYGRDISAKEIARQGKVGIPASGRQLISLLDKQSPKNESDPVSLKE